MKEFGRSVLLPETEIKDGLINNRIGIIQYIQKKEQPKEPRIKWRDTV